MLNRFYSHEQRSEEVMQNITGRIDLMQGWQITANLIHLPYSINGKEQPALTYSTPVGIAEFSLMNQLIDRFEVNGEDVTMFKSMPTFMKSDRWGWCMQVVEEKMIANFPFKISTQQAKRFVAVWYYHNGDMHEVKGRVIQMFPETMQNIA